MMLTTRTLRRTGPKFARAFATSFSELEKTMWNKSASAYADTFAKVTVQAANELLDGAAVPLTKSAAVTNVMTVSPGKFGFHNHAAVPTPRADLPEDVAQALPSSTPFSVLDVATGNGVIAAAAAARGATEVVGVDNSEAMVGLCKPIADEFPGVVSFSVGDAEALPAKDASFDAVILGFCLLHLPDPAKALSEAFRVLKPGGKVSFSVWESPERGNLAFKLVLDAIEKHGDATKELPGAPLPFFHYADATFASSALVTAGFAASSVEVKTIPCVAPLTEPTDLYDMFANATARTRALLEMQTDEQRASIQDAMASEVYERFNGAYLAHTVAPGGRNRTTSWLPALTGTDAPLYDGTPTGRKPYQVPMPCVVASATKAKADAPATKAAKPKKAKKVAEGDSK